MVTNQPYFHYLNPSFEEKYIDGTGKQVKNTSYCLMKILQTAYEIR